MAFTRLVLRLREPEQQSLAEEVDFSLEFEPPNYACSISNLENV